MVCLKLDLLPTLVSALRYGNSGPSCQQVCLVSDCSDSGGEKIFTGVAFLSLVSNYLSCLLKGIQVEADVITIILPVSARTIRDLLHLISTGEVWFHNIEDASAVGTAAEVLGMSKTGWKVEGHHDDRTIESWEDSKIKKNEDWLIATNGHRHHKTECEIKQNENIESEETLSGDFDLIAELTRVRVGSKSLDKSPQTAPDISDEKFDCPAEGCGNTYQKKSSFNKHVRACHRNERIFACNVCGERFSLQGDLLSHRKIHHFSCDKCAAKFKKEYRLKRHKEDMHEPMLCKICNRIYSSKINLAKHVLTHTEKKYRCTCCKKKFSTQSDANHHLESVHSKPIESMFQVGKKLCPEEEAAM